MLLPVGLNNVLPLLQGRWWGTDCVALSVRDVQAHRSAGVPRRPRTIPSGHLSPMFILGRELKPS